MYCRREASQLNVIYLCSLALLKLSSHRPFAIKMNHPCLKLRKLSGVVFVEGTYSDLIIICIHKMLVNGTDALFPIFGTMLTIIANISPYIKCMAAVSSIKLVNLYHLFTSPKFIFESESNHVVLSLLLDTFNNVLQYQYTGKLK
jgi:High-temperature-induced dauer-formation protein